MLLMLHDSLIINEEKSIISLYIYGFWESIDPNLGINPTLDHSNFRLRKTVRLKKTAQNRRVKMPKG